jgi:two-component system, OmpR family, phosphate regulon sensor histidine kinase PhoR
VRSIRRSAVLFPLALLAGSVVVTVIAYAVLPSGVSAVVAVELVVAVLLSIWYGKQLLRPLASLVPAVDKSGAIEFSAQHDASLPIELDAIRSSLLQIAEQQQRQNEERQRLERVRSEFLANVSHELRTPIFAVQGFIETLLDGAIDDPKVNREFLTRAKVQSERLNNLLTDLIDISRIESGEMRMNFELFDIEPLIREIVNDLKLQAKAKGIELITGGNVAPHHRVEAFADHGRIKQVLINLIDNAIKYSPNGGVVRVQLLAATPTKDEITIRVVDTGIGISDVDLPRLFERFYRVSKDRSRSSPGGTGLGLAIVKHIVEAHRGRITVHSTPGEGSTFEFTLHTEPF